MEPVNLSAQTSTHFWQVNKKKKNGGRLKAMFHSLSVHCHCVSKARTLSTITRQIIHSGPAAFTSSTAEVVEVLWRKYHRDLKTHYSLEKVNQARQEKYVEAKDWLKKETRSSFMAEKFKKSPAHKELSKICVEASVLHLSSSSRFFSLCFNPQHVAEVHLDFDAILIGWSLDKIPYGTNRPAKNSSSYNVVHVVKTHNRCTRKTRHPKCATAHLHQRDESQERVFFFFFIIRVLENKLFNLSHLYFLFFLV